MSSPTQPRSDRARGRELALMALCHLESYAVDEQRDALALIFDHPPGSDDGSEIASLVDQSKPRRFAEQLVEHVLAGRTKVDEAIERVSKKWRLSRMNLVDRNVLRLAVVELMDEPRTPRGVVVAEAVRLASRYGSERSAPFVNGLAEALAGHFRPEQGDGGAPK